MLGGDMCPTPLRPLFAHTGSHVARINSTDALTAAVADFSVTCIKLPCPPLISTDLPCPLHRCIKFAPLTYTLACPYVPELHMPIGIPIQPLGGSGRLWEG